MLLTLSYTLNGKALTVDVPVTTRDESHPFSSGKTGFFAGDKVVINGERYQMSCSIVKISPKPANS